MPDIDFYQPDSYEPSTSLGFTIKRVLNSLTRAIDDRMAVHGITDAQWKPLIHLRNGNARTAAELARHGCIDTGAVTRLLDRLESKGLIARVRSTEDRRVVNLELTDEGHRLADLIPGVLCDVINGHLAGFSRDEHALLMGLLHRMLDNGLRMSGDPLAADDEEVA